MGPEGEWLGTEGGAMSWEGPVGKERLGRACERRANGVGLECEGRGLCET